MKIQAIRVYQNISFSRIYVYPVDVEEANALTDTGEQT
jgi:hypothetical protein